MNLAQWLPFRFQPVDEEQLGKSLFSEAIGPRYGRENAPRLTQRSCVGRDGAEAVLQVRGS